MRNNVKKIALLLAVVLVMMCAMTGCGRDSRNSDRSNSDDTNKEVINEVRNDDDNDDRKSPIGRGEMTSEEVAAYSKTRVVKVITNTGNGSGFFIDSEGTLITNYHVIENVESISIKFDNGATYAVKSIVDFSPYYDIAVLKADVSGNDYFKLADSYSEGESVYVRGYPKNAETSSFTSGMMSQTSHQLGLMDCITIDAAISGGNSGGPAMNSRGEVLGICSYTRTDAQNMNFAIKLSALDELSMDKDYNINRYREWYDRETSRSYMATENGKDFYYTYVNTYTNVTGEECLISYDSDYDYEDGYSIMYLTYGYDYNTEAYDKYCDYLYSIGFEYVGNAREMGMEGVEYYHPFEGYSMALLVDTVDNLLVVTCPMYE